MTVYNMYMNVNEINQWALDQATVEVGSDFTYNGTTYRGTLDQNTMASQLTSHGRETPLMAYNLVVSKTQLPNGLPFHSSVSVAGTTYRVMTQIEEDSISFTYILRKT